MKIDNYVRYAFVEESNRIEGIKRPPTRAELNEFSRFMALKEVSIEELEHFVSVYQPGARLRDIPGLNVRVGSHQPPPGGPQICTDLLHLLATMQQYSPYENHLRYEALHPFSDGNGRSGRMLWAWQMQSFQLGFLHHFYYQALEASRSVQDYAHFWRRPAHNVIQAQT